MSSERTVAIVTPWFGRDLIGGAERLAWDLAHALARTGTATEVLTTCARSFADDWGTNFHRAGVTQTAELVVRRFKVDPRDRVAFTRANHALLSTPRMSLRRDRQPVEPALAAAFAEHNIRSQALVAHLRAHGTRYDAVLFVPYLYGTTLECLPLVAERAFLVPCLHDEPYAYLAAVRDVFAAARGLLFNSDGEGDVAAALYGPWVHARGRVIGHAVDPVPRPREPVVVGGFAPQRARYLLYLGRQDRTKNLDFLLDAFARFRARRSASALQLVLAGPRSGPRRSGDGVVDLGAVNGEVKAALLTYARAVVQPSVNESFSRAIHEAWYARRPVVVHGDCRATARAVEESGGGWIAVDADGWAATFATIDESGDDAVDALGERGWAAATENGDWDAVARRTLAACDALQGRTLAGVRIDQQVPLGAPAVAAYAAALDGALRRAGADAVVSVADAAPARAAAHAIVHVVDGTPRRGRAAARVIHAADGALPEPGGEPVLTPSVALLDVLAARGAQVRLLPPAIDPGAWAGVTPAGDWDDGRLNVVVVGTLAAADVEHVVEVFVALVAVGVDARLLVPADRLDAEAAAALERDRVELDLRDRVMLLGDDRPAQAGALRAAHVAYAAGRATVAELVTPLWFDVPLVAHDDAPAREVVEPCGIVCQTHDPRAVAALLRLVATDRGLRDAIVAEGRRIRARHAPWSIAATLVEVLSLHATPRVTPAYKT